MNMVRMGNDEYFKNSNPDFDIIRQIMVLSFKVSNNLRRQTGHYQVCIGDITIGPQIHF